MRGWYRVQTQANLTEVSKMEKAVKRSGHRESRLTAELVKSCLPQSVLQPQGADGHSLQHPLKRHHAGEEMDGENHSLLPS